MAAPRAKSDLIQVTAVHLSLETFKFHLIHDLTVGSRNPMYMWERTVMGISVHTAGTETATTPYYVMIIIYHHPTHTMRYMIERRQRLTIISRLRMGHGGSAHPSPISQLHPTYVPWPGRHGPLWFRQSRWSGRMRICSKYLTCASPNHATSHKSAESVPVPVPVAGLRSSASPAYRIPLP